MIDLLPPTTGRLFTVGRLDMSSEGLILLTNDGEFANQLTHPRYGVEKTYRVMVAGNPTQQDMNKLKDGVYLSDGKARVSGIRVKGRHKKSTILEMVLDEGKNREIRRVLEHLGWPVNRLIRVSFGPFQLGNLKVREVDAVRPRVLKDALGKVARQFLKMS